MNEKIHIYDCFTYDGEECLDLRLRTHWDRVDWFVIVESNVTFTGQAKQYTFDAKKYEWAMAKIRYIPLDESAFSHCISAWERETAQRNALRTGYVDARPNDVIIIDDVDEILRPGSIKPLEPGTYHQVERMMMYFNCDYLCLSEPLWTRMKAVTGEFALAHTPQEIRTEKKVFNHLKGIDIPLAGWHFSYLGGIKEINRKLERFSHQEFNKNKYKDQERNLKRVLDGKDIYRRPKKWGRVTGFDLNCQPVQSWLGSRPHLFAPRDSHHGGSVQQVVTSYTGQTRFTRTLTRNLLRIWNKF